MILGAAVDLPAWMDAALCAGADPAPFFPEAGESTREAKRLCRACPVRAECLAYALGNESNDTDFGVWGGLARGERRALRRGAEPRPVPSTRICRTCATEKPMDSFGRDLGALDGHMRDCKACRAAAARERRAILTAERDQRGAA